jgi:hypothetical protein
MLRARSAWMSVGVRWVVSEPRYIRGRTWVVGEMGQPPVVRKLGREGMGWKGGDVGCIVVEVMKCWLGQVLITGVGWNRC